VQKLAPTWISRVYNEIGAMILHRVPCERRIAMCYERSYWKSKPEKAERTEQPKAVTERVPPASQPAQPAPVMKKPETVEAELESV
jgi:hypothetical protein